MKYVLKFTMQEAATIRLSTYQNMLKKYEGYASEHNEVRAFSG